MSQSHRLAAGLPPEFSNPLIDRGRPVRFTVNGLHLEGFEGDTVLSALLANGIVGAGTQGGSGVALDEQSAPPLIVEGGMAQMPMVLCPVVEGVRFQTVAARRTPAPFRRLLARRRDTLGHDLDAPRVPGNWIDAEPDETQDTDILVVGGGVAGMSAALAAARRGSRVVLVEREAVLGGMTVFFGKAEGETPPEEVTARLAAEVGAHPSITVVSRAEAFDLSEGRAHVVRVTIENGAPRRRVLAIGFSGAVLATGVEERLPIFAGNRLPRVVAAGFTWRMARHYGVWPGETFHLHTATNAGYRLAILGSESGKTVLRATDPRPDPRTRFIEFCKAYGFRLGWGAAIASAVPERDRLAIRLAGHQFGGEGEPVRAHALIVAGGWQPDIALWLLAGGATAWDSGRGQLVEQGNAGRVALAGSVTGIAGTGGCMESGAASIDQLHDGRRRAIADPRIDEIHESRDGSFSVQAPASRGLPPAWLAPSRRAAMAEPPLRGVAAFVLRQPGGRTEDIRAANLSDVAGAVAGGAIEPAQASAYSAQWHIVPRAFKAAALPAGQPQDETGLPGYLEGRFGFSQARWSLVPEGGRAFEPGCLVFINTDETHPGNAIGAIVSGTETDCIALMARTEFGAGDVVYIRDGATATPARLRRKL